MISLKQQQQRQPKILRISPSNRIVFICMHCGEIAKTQWYANIYKPCTYCKESFLPTNAVKVGRATYYNLKCEVCYVDFTSERKDRQYCSKNCLAVANKRKLNVRQ